MSLPSAPTNILLIQLGDIGDVVLTTPSIRALKETYPQAHVSILVSKPYGSLLKSDPNICEVVEIVRTRGSLLHRLREFITFAKYIRHKNYGLVIDLRTGDRGAILSFLTGAAIRVGCHGNKNQFWHNYCYTTILSNLQAAPLPAHPGADQSLRILRKLGIDTSDSIPKLNIAPETGLAAAALLSTVGIASGGRFISINPFSRWKYKEWSNQKWGEVIDRIWEVHHIPSVIIGSIEEAADCQSILEGREARTFSLAGKTTLAELAAVISMSSLHLGVDSAAPHIAAALGTPTLTIHGPTDWRAWRIVDALHQVVSPNMSCLPCNRTGCEGSGRSKCLDELTTEPVTHIALGLLAAAPT
ncbi:MAG: glycosyltransferase family 9 protein [Sideroxydans sp.]|jgi:heptosyltransferase-3